MNIKESIMSIMEKYGLNISGKLYETSIKEEIVKILNQIPKNKIVAIRGAGYHTEELLSIEGCTLQFKYIFDYSRQEKGIVEIAGKELEVYPCSMIDQLDIDIMIISSYAHRKKIRDELEKSQKKFIILDLYDELRKSGLDVNTHFYRNAEDTYENVIYYRKKYLADSNDINLKNLLVSYLNIFDFINFKKFANKYILCKYPGYKDIQMAIEEIVQILDNIKTRLKKRKQRDIITVWNDQLDYSWLQYAPYMYKLSRNSMFFENAYTMTPFTVPTFLEMFLGMKPIDNEIYHKPFPVISSFNSNMVKEIEDSGYKFIYIGDEGDSKLFEKEYVVTNYTYSSSCFGCISLLQKLLNTEEPVFVILHVSEETHNPYMSGELDDAKYYEWPRFGGDPEEKALEQRKKSVRYWDKQLEFYMDFISDRSIRIFMSDHGARYNFQPIYKEPTTHIIFFITGAGVSDIRCSKLFSLYNFHKVAKCVINNNYNEEEIFSDYVLIQETSIFNKTAIQYYFENNAIECSYGFRAVRTKEELYVKLSSGKKYYYLLPDEELNCIEQADPGRLKWLDGLAGDTFEDLSKYNEEIESFRKQFETHE